MKNIVLLVVMLLISDLCFAECDQNCPSIGGPDYPCPTWSEPLRLCHSTIEEPSCVAKRTACNTKQIPIEAVVQTTAPALAIWLQGSRNTAATNAMPIPQYIRNALSGYIEEDLMNRVSYKVGDNGVINLAAILQSAPIPGYGDVAGVTLIDVIVFKDNNAANDPQLWAHELTHVKQFRDWGVKDFAIRYVRNNDAVESAARDVERGYASWFNSHLPAGIMMSACTCATLSSNIASEPRCASGYVVPSVCQGMGMCGPYGGMPYAWVCSGGGMSIR